MPHGIGRDLWFDLSPMRPDEWGAQEAGPWLRAEALQGAYRKGRETAEIEHHKRDLHKAKEVEARQRLKEKAD